MSAVYSVQTKRGIRAWISRRIELFTVNATLSAAERDREYLNSQLESLPFEIDQKDKDIGALRARQIHLRNT